MSEENYLKLPQEISLGVMVPHETTSNRVAKSATGLNKCHKDRGPPGLRKGEQRYGNMHFLLFAPCP